MKPSKYKSRKNLPFREGKKTLSFFEAWKSYKRKMKVADKQSVNSTTYSKVNKEFNGILMDYLFTTGDKIRFSHGLGELEVIKRKVPADTKKRRPNFRLSKKLGFTAYFNNKHSNGYYALIKWKKFNKMLPQATPFDFEPTPYNRRKLYNLILTKDTMNRYKLA